MDKSPRDVDHGGKLRRFCSVCGVHVGNLVAKPDGTFAIVCMASFGRHPTAYRCRLHSLPTFPPDQGGAQVVGVAYNPQEFHEGPP